MPYDATQWLVDRANIHDTVIALMLYVDTRQFDRVASEVLATELLVDYTSLLGGEPYTISNTEQAKMWEGMLTKLHATQHGILSPLVDLGQPSAEREAPKTATALVNGGATLVRKSADDETIVQNGGRYELELTRTATAPGTNPWRISKMKAIGIWSKGDTQAMVGDSTDKA
ncbi:uncharacterized protein SCHCODRAFT_02504998 [Schizophyllum commune H4-8]|uniref:SnoaL-like domain-containing protein n=1 Tax=Schizophyllum commune (strain H4-8 / FGSC 9210) TaxID=578458 RepID=D8Q7A6_SCHCM|nr:uncharacterized protein SCHCODRAFT_02504998 [Schizophyllum commune H4-8]KAI5891576.1 hypothetical protein SCHCODRAFT_02504998 [Schizophyllum commune H4-8]